MSVKKMSTKELRNDVKKHISNGVRTIRFVSYIVHDDGCYLIDDIHECEVHEKYRYGSMYDKCCKKFDNHNVVIEPVWGHE